MSAPATTRLRGRPERIFVSVDESTGRSTMSFLPAGISDPVLREGDRTGAAAMREAASLIATYPGCTVHGPHFHAARPPGRTRMRRKKEE
jgi:hypothetical protein